MTFSQLHTSKWNNIRTYRNVLPFLPLSSRLKYDIHIMALHTDSSHCPRGVNPNNCSDLPNVSHSATVGLKFRISTVISKQLFRGLQCTVKPGMQGNNVGYPQTFHLIPPSDKNAPVAERQIPTELLCTWYTNILIMLSLACSPKQLCLSGASQSHEHRSKRWSNKTRLCLYFLVLRKCNLHQGPVIPLNKYSPLSGSGPKHSGVFWGSFLAH